MFCLDADISGVLCFERKEEIAYNVGPLVSRSLRGRRSKGKGEGEFEREARSWG